MNAQEIISLVKSHVKEPLWENWYIKEKIGEGTFSVVYKIEAKRPTRTDFSALKIEAITADGSLFCDETRKRSYIETRKLMIQNESEIMYKLRNSPYIVTYEEESVQELYVNGEFEGYLFLIKMELLDCVTDIIKSKKMNFTEKNIIKLALDIGRGIKAAHDFGVIHRDIKPGNFFLSPDGMYKLGDFNVSKKTQTAHTFAGTEGYLAPEIYRAKENVNHSYTMQADIYSFGICLYQFMNNLYFPFEETYMTDDAIIRRMAGEKLAAPKNASDQFSRIIMRACAFNPCDRYKSMDELIADLMKLDAQQSESDVSSLQITNCDLGATVYADASTDKPFEVDGNATVYAEESMNSFAPHRKSTPNGKLSFKIGDMFEFGKYNNTPIRWRVMGIDDDKITAVCCDEINSKRVTDYNWLNEHFHKYSFTNSEKECIISSISPVTVKRMFLVYVNDAFAFDANLMWCWDNDSDDYILAIDNDEYYDGYSDEQFTSPLIMLDPLKFEKAARNYVGMFRDECQLRSQSFKVGEIIEFGFYKGRKILWKVLECTPLAVKMISCDCLEFMPFHRDRSTNKYWDADISKWVNQEFFLAAFKPHERDYIFHLSLLERSELTSYFKREVELSNGSWWWLKTPIRTTKVERINGDGSLSKDGNCVDDSNGGVRPVITIRVLPQ